MSNDSIQPTVTVFKVAGAAFIEWQQRTVFAGRLDCVEWQDGAHSAVGSEGLPEQPCRIEQTIYSGRAEWRAENDLKRAPEHLIVFFPPWIFEVAFADRTGFVS
jgi:hypothetical protein